MTEKELMLLERCINTVRLTPNEINDFVSMTDKLQKLLKDQEEKTDDL